MVRAKNYETVSTFVEIRQKKLWPLFSGHGVYRLQESGAVVEKPHDAVVKFDTH